MNSIKSLKDNVLIYYEETFCISKFYYYLILNKYCFAWNEL